MGYGVRVITGLGDSDQRAALNALFGVCLPQKPPVHSTPRVDLLMGLLLSIEAAAIARF